MTYGIHICGIGVCSVYGKSYSRHWYDKKTGNCYRCGYNKKDK